MLPADASNKDVAATSEDPTIAKVEWDSTANAFKLTMLKEGNVKLDWKSSDGNASKEQNVTVTEAATPTSTHNS